jgi:uncharacterized protein (UPF0248 family)
MKKYIPEHKVKRMRNIISKKYSDKTKIQIGYGKKDGEYKEGDIWEENGKQWTIKNGITQSVTKLDKVRKSFNMPLVCPKCNTKVMKGSVDRIFWNLYEECSDCRIMYETKLKIKNEKDYHRYETEEITKNFKSYMKTLNAVAEQIISETNRKRVKSIGENLTKKYEKLNKEQQ